MSTSSRVLVAGEGQGEVLHLGEGISFWGAVDPLNGTIIDQRHPMAGQGIGARVLVMNRAVGSSSGSAILLETLHRGCGPAGIVLAEADQILTLGAVVAREMGYGVIPVVQLDAVFFERLSGVVSIDSEGIIESVR
ncbi:MAG: DUF126 domain-containing protein [Xanthomonadales bacterium]|nr:DUF126 domain-containing protein [Xanthomonadales bacterium]